MARSAAVLLLAPACIELHPAWSGHNGSAGVGGGGTSSTATAGSSSTNATSTSSGTATGGGSGATGASSTAGTSGVSDSGSTTGTTGGGSTTGTTGGGSTTGTTGGSSGGSNTMFITAGLYPPMFSAAVGEAPTGADMICQQEADAAGLTGTFLALLRTSNSDGSYRVGAAEGWRDANGRPIANTVADLNNSRWFGYLETDAAGNRPTEQGFWSGRNGGLTETCQDWTSTSSQNTGSTGTMDRVDRMYYNQTHSCDVVRPLLCASIDNTDPITFTAAAGSRLVFLSASIQPPGTDLAGMDALCQDDFETVFGTTTGRTFAALVAPTVGATPASRLASLPEIPWVRADDVQVAGSTTELATEVWTAFLNVRPDGTHYANSFRDVIIGAHGLQGISTEATSCDGWTRADAGQTYRVGAFGRWTSKTDRDDRVCDSTGDRHVYCFESTTP